MAQIEYLMTKLVSKCGILLIHLQQMKKGLSMVCPSLVIRFKMKQY